ncbi:hypothetical protein TNCV_4986641 [Trichonephila clavipes]|nr:hypothetical protein TNCV_4986641 [Trichonephila clavipes]
MPPVWRSHIEDHEFRRCMGVEVRLSLTLDMNPYRWHNKSRETKQLRNSKGKKPSYSAQTYNDQTEKIENLEKKFAKLELKFEENNNIFEKKLEQIVQRFTTELNTVVAQINLSFSSLMNTMDPP